MREAPEVAAYRDAAVGALWKDKEGASVQEDRYKVFRRINTKCSGG